MLKIVLIGDIEDQEFLNAREALEDPFFEVTNLYIQEVDSGSKKTQRRARSYFSKYAASKVFIVFENEADEVLSVVYKEEIHENNWKAIIISKLTKLLNEN